ncbi:periplasmic sensor signal transduction histidine kinase [Acidisarcina polymorpha]|uniref:histidine kinase n=1 Tax=Acidisarcina polymorpha TaxID=2211140 RepID=A0A2Z5FUX5_9BACT|nr:ATP-binding protein [Acidisarcina polymorpha]AXC10155.1 periplasmic sensor signal transduction histidine kinase [Acidisarcina polymorpha]
MFSKIGKTTMRSAAWRISLWATLAFACGTMVVFVFLHRFVSKDIQRRSDAWLSGEVEVLGDVAARTRKDALYGRVVGEVAELASREVPNRLLSSQGQNDSVFFLQTGADGSLALWVGAGNGVAYLDAIRHGRRVTDTPTDLRVDAFDIPFRVASVAVGDGTRIYLGLSERDERRLLRSLRFRFLLLWLAIVLIGAAIVFYTTRRMLGHVRGITEAASRIGESDLRSRVPTSRRKDEIAQLASTLNTMLDRIENSVHQLHTITDSLAHDLRSPLTAVRAKLEMALTGGAGEEAESVVTAIEELDRVTDFLNKSLDVAEAKADALRLDRVAIDLDQLLRSMVDLYEPSMSERGLRIQLRSAERVEIWADSGLLHRMIANLFDNELKHLPPSSTVAIALRAEEGRAILLVEDDGPGFAPEIAAHIFERRVKGPQSNGHGLGLAFVEAVARAHGGSTEAANRIDGGARLIVTLPLFSGQRKENSCSVALLSLSATK